MTHIKKQAITQIAPYQPKTAHIINLSAPTKQNKKQWNQFVYNSQFGHLMQSYEWGIFKTAEGWQVHRLALKQDQEIIAGVQLLIKPIIGNKLAIGYIPKGPLVDLNNQYTTTKLLAAVHHIARTQGCIFLKIEPNVLNSPQTHTYLKNYGFHSTPTTNQPRSTLLVSLSGGEKAVLQTMRKTTRKLLNRAKHNGVQIIEGDTQDIDNFYAIIKNTATLKGFSIHNKPYFEHMWYAFKATNAVKLLLATYKNQTVAAKMIFIFNNRSLHLWGGTCPLGRKQYASYLIQWEAIKWAIKQGCDYADLWGIPDEVGQMIANQQPIPKNKQGNLWGVYNFKRGFGNKVEFYVGAYDYVYKPWLYKLITTVFSPENFNTFTQLLKN